MDFIKDVKEFHELFGHKISDSIDISDEKTNKLRVELLSEEIQELSDALEDNDKVEVGDALCDTMYVLAGAILSLGYEDKFEAMFNEVHSSNMSKLCENMTVVEQTLDFYNSKDIGVSYKPVDENDPNTKYIIYRLLDGKILKSVNYRPANLGSIINEYSTRS